MRQPRVYIAGPYRSDPVGNTANAIEIADDLAHLGVTPFVPHLSLLWDLHRPNPTQFYLDLDIEWLEACDAMFVLPGPSRGTDAEIARMLILGRPVFFGVAELLSWADQWRVSNLLDAFASLREHAEDRASEREEALPLHRQPVESTPRPPGGSVDAPVPDCDRSLTRDERAILEAVRGRYAHVIPVPPRCLSAWAYEGQEYLTVEITVADRATSDQLCAAAHAGKLWLVAEVTP